jgi:hypothetical protein
MAVNGGKTPHWAAKPTTKAKPTKVVRKKAKAKKPKKATQRSYGKILTTSDRELLCGFKKNPPTPGLAFSCGKTSRSSGSW